jgi:hypothetical protein
VKLHAGRVLCHWSYGLEQSSTEGGSLQMLLCSHYIVWFHCVWSMSEPTRLFIWMHEKIPKKTARRSLPEDEHLVVQNTSKTIELNH